MSPEILILGAGWTSTFLIPLCVKHSITYASTSRTGRDSTIKFEFDPESEDIEPYKLLPDAQTILITFPIESKGAPQRLVELYKATRGRNDVKTAFIQLGTTGVWDGTRKKIKESPQQPVLNKWYDRHTPIAQNARGLAEEELLALSPHILTTVINLAGLWGGARSPRNWVTRVASTKEALRNKGSIHLVHGIDVARAILAVHANFSKAQGQRWLLTDGRVYDWWDLASAWGSPPKSPGTDFEDKGPQARWVQELMMESDTRALPRDIGVLGRALDSREFWSTFSLSPLKAILEGE